MAKKKTKSSIKRNKGSDEKYCSSCGEAIKKKAELCPYCGVRQRDQRRSHKPEKSKVVGIVLAIFLGFWTWLYTYRKDAWKFWTGLAINILLFWTIIVPIGIWLWAIIDVATNDEEVYRNYYKLFHKI